MNYKFVIFDYDGTICDSHPAIIHSLEHTFSSFSLPVPAAATIERVMETGIGIADTISTLHPEKQSLNDQVVDAMVNAYRSIYNTDGDQHTRLFDGAQELFKTLYANKVIIIVVSNKGIKAVEKSLAAFELIEYTDTIIADGIYPPGQLKMKPDPMNFNEIIRPRYSFTGNDKGLMIGDTSADIKFAQNCQLDSCWAAYGYGNKEECIALNPDFTIHELTTVLNII